MPTTEQDVVYAFRHQQPMTATPDVAALLAGGRRRLQRRRVRRLGVTLVLPLLLLGGAAFDTKTRGTSWRAPA